MNYSIVEVNADNLSDYPYVICFINPKHEFFSLKINWLKQRFAEGLKIKLLFLEGEKRPFGFIEYIPGENAWRAVDCKKYMFIHCLWTNGKKYQHQGLGKVLLEEAEKDAQSRNGVAVITSDKAFMAKQDFFIKNGYKVVEKCGKEQLLVKTFSEKLLPKLNRNNDLLVKYQELTIIYSKQCPWVARFMEEIKPVFVEKKLNPNIIEITTAKEAQNAPGIYSVFNLIYKGEILADRYISTTRFLNILNKKIKTGGS
ncbi:MAG: GNAT family N-acetyltransferase [bacterium]|nr:GNAT family N-acetyltransferase [bacterium]